ncbi:MAG: polysaccharide deacetylase family protein [Armatimonadetes bacterium]|nr:polysaccharide deacetylase family protein [Armatimonadota bacterium]
MEISKLRSEEIPLFTPLEARHNHFSGLPSESLTLSPEARELLRSGNGSSQCPDVSPCPLPSITPEAGALPPDADKFQEMMEQTRTLEGYNRYFRGVDSLSPVKVKVVEKIPTVKSQVFLTFDDGPFGSGDGYEATTPELLRILKDKKAQATFFFQGYWAWKHPEISKEVVSQGSNIGNHTYHHPPDGYFQGPIPGQKKKFGDLEPGEQAQELLWGRAGILWGSRKNAGILPLFRSPHGSAVLAPSHDPKTLERIAKNGHVIINGNLRLSDAKPDITAEKLISTYRDYFRTVPPGARKGEILWLHSGLKATREALPVIIDELKALGYEVAALPPCLGARENAQDAAA